MGDKKYSPEEDMLQSVFMPEDQRSKLGAVVAALRLAASNASQNQRVAEAFMLALISQNVRYKLSATVSGQYVSRCIDRANEEMKANLTPEEAVLLKSVFNIMNGEGCE